MSLLKKRIPFYVGITTLVVVIVLTLSGLFLWISHRESKTAAIHMADRLFTEINAKTLARYENTLESVAILAGTIARMPGMTRTPSEDELVHQGMEVMLKALSFHNFLFSMYCGYDDGSFIQIVAVRDKAEVRGLFGAPGETAYVLRTISTDPAGARKQRWRFLNREGKIIGERDDLDPGYDPRARIWYLQAQSEEAAFFTEPYIFSSTKLPGITCAEKLSSGGGVFGADITLDRFAVSLGGQNISENGTLFLFDRSGRILAHPKEVPVKFGAGEALKFPTGEASADPRVRTVVAAYSSRAAGVVGDTVEMEIEGVAHLVRYTPLKALLKLDQILASTAPVSDFTGHLLRMQHRVFLFSGVVMLVMLPIALLIARRISSSLVRLEKESIRIQQSDFSGSEPFDSHIKEIHSLIVAFFLMKNRIRRLLDQQRKLFDDFTKLIAGAIDAKSPYTGGHCARVPILAQMIADAACGSGKRSLAGFDMNTPDERWEFEVAAWLHDCGKITTPEFVVDKATKLETIHNRIHEIRTRFEVLWRDAEIDWLRKRLAGDVDEGILAKELAEARDRIAADFAFVARCNIGGEFMADEDIERLHRIAEQTWQRHLDDRIGISHEETVLKSREPERPLPVVEHVLADKPEHLIPRLDPDPFDGNPHRFIMKAPDYDYNRGELYNLGIRKGTLTAEDRFKIEEHIIQTIFILSRLEFPEYLKNVPEIAGAHHETMSGTGYPRGLTKEQIPIAARIIAVADIFEALTAADRPYKKPKPLSEALRIMNRMSREQHIDPDLFDLFLESGVYRTYAEDHLDPSQIDVADITPYLSGTGGVR
ncbi:MAG: HD domain-containing phosphohydrolase [Desulfobacterales bacterium]